MFGRLLVVGALLSVAAFGTGCASVSIHVARSSYAAGDSGYVQITNEGWRTAYGNFCATYTLERRRGSAWIPVERDDRRCTKQLDGYAPGSRRPAVFHIPRDTPNGIHRLVSRLDGRADDRVTSNEFVVVGSAGTADGPPKPTTNAQRMSADTPRSTAAGTSFIAPQGWAVATSGVVTTLEMPEGDGRLALCEVGPAKDVRSAVAAAWAAYGPQRGAKLPVKSELPLSDRDGWVDRSVTTYVLSPNERREVAVTTMRSGDGWTVVILDAQQATAEKRRAQTALFFDRLLPKGYTRESFAGRTPHRLDAQRIKALTAFIERARIAVGVPGVALGLVQGGKVIFEGGFGVRQLGRNEKVDANTLCLVASTTKALTTLMLGKLVDAGRLTWDTPVTRVLPEFYLDDTATTKSVLVKHLVCACTGLPRQDLEWILQFEGTTPASMLASLANIQPTTKFGEMFQYSNNLAAVGGYVGARVLFPQLELGAGYDLAMTTEVFGPLAMRATTFDFKRALRGNHATPHAKSIDDTTEIALLAPCRSTIPMRPTGGAWSSVRDMLKYVTMETRRGLLPSGRRYISDQVLADRRAPQVAMGKDSSYGMGLWQSTRYGIPVVSHTGSLFGFKSQMLWLPEHEVGGVVLTNGDTGNGVTAAFFRKLLEVLFDGRDEADTDLATWTEAMHRDIRDDRNTLTAPVPGETAAMLAERYRSPALGEVMVVRRPDALTFDFGEWASAVASRRNPDGTTSFITITPGVYGFELVAGRAGEQRTLTMRDAQHEYTFTER